MPYTQTHTYLSLTTPLGPDKLPLQGFHGEEQLSGLFHFTLEMVAEDKNLDFAALVGKSATITLQLENGQMRYLNGIIGRCYQGGSDGRFTTYYADLHPWLWLLTKTADCRIFQEQSVPEMVTALFQELNFTDYANRLTKSYDKRPYCVQYQETAFNFVARLLEEEGIFYFFAHTDGKHTLVLADDADAHKPCPGLQGPVRYRSALTVDDQDAAITHCTYEQGVTTGKYATDDYNFETPATDLLVEIAGKAGDLRIYEDHGRFTTKAAGNQRARLRLESHEVGKTRLCGESVSAALVTGYSFDLVGFDRAAANTKYVLHKVAHQATQEAYTNHFEAFPASVPFRPLIQTPRPTIPGTQTALVVGKQGEEIWTDRYGRVMVQFHWDQRGQKDEKSSCWIRVAQGWAGKSWGALFLPRIGQEVVVSFINGDPDRPLITGAVYNAEQVVPYTLPTEQTKSTIKSNSSKGGGGFNEIRFDDKKDAEELFIHAQKDMKVTVEHDRTTTIQTGNEMLTVTKGDRTIAVKSGDERHTVKGKRTVTVSDNETHTNQADFTQEVKGNFTLKVTGNLTLDVTGAVTIKAGQDLTNKAGMSLTNEAGLSLTNKGSASQTVESSGIVTVKGALVKIN